MQKENNSQFQVWYDSELEVYVTVHSMNVPAMTSILGFIVRAGTKYTTYVIQFIGQGKEQGGIVLNDRPSCDRVLEVLRQRFPIAAG